MLTTKCKVGVDENYALYQNDDGSVRVFFVNDDGFFVGARECITEKDFGLMLKELYSKSNCANMDCCSMPVEE